MSWSRRPGRVYRQSLIEMRNKRIRLTHLKGLRVLRIRSAMHSHRRGRSRLTAAEDMVVVEVAVSLVL
jgi:hypothetical protein